MGCEEGPGGGGGCGGGGGGRVDRGKGGGTEDGETSGMVMRGGFGS